MSTAVRTVLALLLAGVLAGCAGTTVITSEYLASNYHPRYLNSVAKYGGLRLRVVGNPFDAPKPQVEATIARVMGRAHPGPSFPLVTSPDGAAARSPYHMVVVFNPAAYLGRYQVCAGDARQGRPAAGGIRMLMVFCVSNTAISSLVAEVPGVSGPGDARFVGVLGQATVLLMPPSPAEPDASGDWEI